MNHIQSAEDRFIVTRSILFGNVERMLETLGQIRNSKKIESDDLFFHSDDAQPATKLDLSVDVPMKTKLAALVEEKESLGLYVSGDPLAEYAELVEYVRDCAYSDDIHLILVNSIKKIFTKANQMMFALNASTASLEVDAIIFPKRALDLSPIIKEKELFWVKGKLSNTATKSTTQKVSDEGEIQEYDELPKLPVNELVPFKEGVLALFRSSDQSLSESSIKKLSSLDWNTLYTSPHLLSTQLSPVHKPEEVDTQPQQILDKKQAEPVSLYIPESVGVDTLKSIKQALLKSPQTGYTEAIIYIQKDGAYKKAKDTFWCPEELIMQYGTKH